MTALKYKDLISKSQAQVESEELDLQVQEAKSNIELTIARTKSDLAKAKRELTKKMCAVPYDLQSEVNAMSNVKELEAGLAYAEQVLKERFD